MFKIALDVRLGLKIPDHRSECREAINTQGRSCGAKRDPCPLTKCYRHGWAKWRVDADNLELVAKEHGMSVTEYRFVLRAVVSEDRRDARAAARTAKRESEADDG